MGGWVGKSLRAAGLGDKASSGAREPPKPCGEHGLGLHFKEVRRKTKLMVAPLGRHCGKFGLKASGDVGLAAAALRARIEL